MHSSFSQSLREMVGHDASEHVLTSTPGPQTLDINLHDVDLDPCRTNDSALGCHSNWAIIQYLWVGGLLL